MEISVARHWTEERIAHCRELAGIKSSTFHLLGEVENYAFYFEQEPDKILRVTHSSHRSEAQIQAELQFLNYLGDCHVPVARALPLASGELLSRIDLPDNTHFILAMFCRARGEQVKKEHYGPRFYEAWGSALGLMHRLTKELKPSGARPVWNTNPYLNLIPWYAEEEREQFLEIRQNLVNEIADLPKTRDSYGLLHADLHQGNFYWDGQKIQIFDFDDSIYHYFTYDLTVCAFSALRSLVKMYPDQSREKLTADFMEAFLNGYEPQNSLDPFWIKKIPLFCRLRDLDIYGLLNHKSDPQNLDEEEKTLLAAYKQRIMSQSSFLPEVF